MSALIFDKPSTSEAQQLEKELQSVVSNLHGCDAVALPRGMAPILLLNTQDCDSLEQALFATKKPSFKI